MSCIVGIQTPQGVFLGGDSAFTDDDGVQRMAVGGKLGRLEQEGTRLLFGGVGDCRFLQLLQYELQLPPYEQALGGEAYLVHAFVPAVRSCLKTAGFAKEEQGCEYGGHFLVGVAGQLFQIQRDYHVLASVCGYNAIGSGDACALGALAVTAHLSPEQRILVALRATTAHIAYVRPPYHISFLSLEQELRQYSVDS